MINPPVLSLYQLFTILYSVTVQQLNKKTFYTMKVLYDFQTIEEESETAANCFAVAQSTQLTAPILPFTSIPLGFE
jgi:hypothetical protein